MKWGCCGNQSFIHPIEHRKGKWWVGLASLDWSRFICPNQLLNQNLQPDCAMIPAGSWHLPNPFLCWLTWSHELTSKATSCKMESLAYFFSVVSFRCNTWKKLRTSRTGLAYQPGWTCLLSILLRLGVYCQSANLGLLQQNSFAGSKSSFNILNLAQFTEDGTRARSTYVKTKRQMKFSNTQGDQIRMCQIVYIVWHSSS